MTEAQAQAATAAYGQLLAARQELDRLLALRPLLRGVTLDTGPGGATVGGVGTVRVPEVGRDELRRLADVAERALRSRIADLEGVRELGSC